MDLTDIEVRTVRDNKALVDGTQGDRMIDGRFVMPNSDTGQLEVYDQNWTLVEGIPVDISADGSPYTCVSSKISHRVLVLSYDKTKISVVDVQKKAVENSFQLDPEETRPGSVKFGPNKSILILKDEGRVFLSGTENRRSAASCKSLKDTRQRMSKVTRNRIFSCFCNLQPMM